MSDEIKKENIEVESPVKNKLYISDVKESFGSKINFRSFFSNFGSVKYENQYAPQLVSNSYGIGSTKISNADIGSANQDPYNGYQTLQNASEYLDNNSIYNYFLNYYSTLLTFNYYVYPNIIRVMKPKVLENSFLEASRVIRNINVKQTFPKMLRRVLKNGETYWYDVSDSKNNVVRFAEIPSDICELAKVDESGLWRYYVNLNKITFQMRDTLPREIRTAYDLYITNKNKNKNVTRNKRGRIKVGVVEEKRLSNLYLVSNSGFAIFAHEKVELHDYPFFNYMLEDFNSLETDKEYYRDYIKADNVKLIHNKIPYDEEDGSSIFLDTDVKAFHLATCAHTPSNVSVITNPFDTTGINLNKSQEASVDIVETSTKNVTDGLGYNYNILHDNGEWALRFAIQSNANIMANFLGVFTTIVNHKIKYTNMAVNFMDINKYDEKDWYFEYNQGVSMVGDIRSKFIATGNSEIYDYIQTAKMETAIDIDQYLPIKANAFQTNGNDVSDANKSKSNEKVDKKKKNNGGE